MDTTFWLRAVLFGALAGCPSGPLNRSDCSTDDDCEDGRICEDVAARAGYSEPILQCIPSECTSDDDCAGACRRITWSTGCKIAALDQCSSTADSCASDADCDEGLACIPADRVSGALACLEPVNCAIGRPLSGADGSIVTPLVTRSDWMDEVPLGAASSDPKALAPVEVVEHWRAVAALEHASVGSFARFTLELLALGAPPDLLAEAQRASADEIRHASAVLGWVHALSGDSLGPGALDVSALVISSDPHEVFGRLVAEGCVGESVGAALARADAEAAEAPALRRVLFGIAEDEARHAALAWRTAAWMCRRWPSLRDDVTRHTRAAIAALRGIQRPEGCETHGVIGSAAAHRLVCSVAREVLEPLAQTLATASTASTGPLAAVQGASGASEATRTITT